jgi:hypothetical protein
MDLLNQMAVKQVDLNQAAEMLKVCAGRMWEHQRGGQHYQTRVAM